MTERSKGLSAIFDTRSEFFRPLWLRVVIFAIAAGMTILEFLRGDILWGVLFGLFAVMGFYGFFIDPKRPSAGPPPQG